VQVAGADLLVEASVIRDNLATAAGDGGRGVNAEHSYTDANAPTNVTIRGAVIERNRDCGVCAFGSNLVVEDTVIRDTEPTIDGVHGRGINLQPSTGLGHPSTLSVTRSVVEGNHDTGIFVSGETTVEHSVVRRTMSDAHGAFGRGILAQVDQGMPFSFSLAKSLVEDNVETGVLMLGAQSTVEATAVRRSTVGRGIGVQTERGSGITSKLSLTTSLIDDNAVEGIYMGGGETAIDASVVRATRPDAAGNFGRGLGIQGDAVTGAPSTFVMSRSLIDQNYEAGAFFMGALATIESSAIIMAPNVHPLGAPSISMKPLDDWDVPSTVTIRSTLLEASATTAIDVLSSTATIEGSIVRNTRPRPLDGLFGDSLFIDSQTRPSTAKLIATRLEHGTRSALLSWGGHALLERSEFVCHAFDFDAGTTHLGTARFEDLGGNGCGCPIPDGTCKLVTTGIAPPEPLPPSAEGSM
jgi:hypothetical protein